MREGSDQALTGRSAPPGVSTCGQVSSRGRQTGLRRRNRRRLRAPWERRWPSHVPHVRLPCAILCGSRRGERPALLQRAFGEAQRSSWCEPPRALRPDAQPPAPIRLIQFASWDTTRCAVRSPRPARSASRPQVAAVDAIRPGAVWGHHKFEIQPSRERKGAWRAGQGRTHLPPDSLGHSWKAGSLPAMAGTSLEPKRPLPSHPSPVPNPVQAVTQGVTQGVTCGTSGLLHTLAGPKARVWRWSFADAGGPRKPPSPHDA